MNLYVFPFCYRLSHSFWLIDFRGLGVFPFTSFFSVVPFSFPPHPIHSIFLYASSGFHMSHFVCKVLFSYPESSPHHTHTYDDANDDSRPTIQMQHSTLSGVEIYRYTGILRQRSNGADYILHIC